MNQEYDLIVIGCGPAGEVLASTVGAAGYNVLVIERWPEPYPLPRLTTLDGECCRVVQATSADVDKGFEQSTIQNACHFVDRDGEDIMKVLYPGKLAGWPTRLSIFQPDFEKGITDKLESLPNVRILRGFEVLDFSQNENSVTVEFSPFDANRMIAVGNPEKVTAKYMAGTDGARSFVRSHLGLEQKDFDMHERWLNFDAELKRPLPEKFHKLAIFMDPSRPHMYMPIGEKYLRLEFRVMEGETDEDVTDPSVAWDFLTKEHGLGSDDVNIMRQVVYHYHTRITQQWRKDRIFIAGDAAHTMPPYMGQGGCAAIRDGRNLGWKLIEVLSERSSEKLLDTYQSERMPHASTIIMGSDMLSRQVNIVDPSEAEKRDSAMRERGSFTPPDLPSLSSGILYFEKSSQETSIAGKMTPQGTVGKNGKAGRGDDLIGSGFQLWCAKDPSTFLNEESTKVITRLAIDIAVFNEPESQYAYEDIEGIYQTFLENNDAAFVLVRPDFYAFGSGSFSQINDALLSLKAQLFSNY
ncbi:bifunctional 3-(3-hydroxy-phenyl)propionate/3-hydroxycinnamic acid hydroxylase [Alteromonas sp. RKMC-009]|uniref:bifunctional 3-(3-hydroxy-phenyl)propionate/3-hydroxycinnamic acid hydroxylase n=1 Tax=Alteromonas sp. RKMC-009 TaxID=2267264 RepID=UPI000E68B654|nr:bifunctional 3-(3-hydroxy-phenyl)propionate/3-hydroxycinnamic acid hydroxylase [Alteromonas sp. RKMC-009]AYA63529.1 bifunctional 3-(3-hydroxy-phenyl)propionate/3-hydroxycinnamic acid hydroxylase [Alteromonas sp. RKMC-009]